MKSMHHTASGLAILAALGLALPGCGDSNSSGEDHPSGIHTHADGSTHDDHASDTGAADEHMGEEDHAHDETALEAATVGDMTLELAQGHGSIEPGKEGLLVVKLPYTDNGETIVRAWIGGEDRTLSMVGMGEYAPSHDDYDIHAVAPDPLPENTMWWIEIEKPDGTKVVGSAKPIMQ